MKKNHLFKKCATFLLLFCMLSISSYYYVPAITVSSADVQPMSDDIRWRYKEVNGNWFKRLYNYTTHTWIGNWIPVNS